MDWFPWYFSLYKADTMHLDPYQDGCYRRLIDHYMETRQPLPDNDHALARIVGDSHPNWVAMAGPIVRSFFNAENGKLYSKRCEQILADQDERSRKLSESGKNGASKRWNKINGADSHPIAKPKPPYSQGLAQDKTGQDNTKNIINKPDDISDNTWKDFLVIRSKKKAPLTKTSLNGIIRESKRSGISLEQALQICVERNWQGFNASWLTEKEMDSYKKPKSVNLNDPFADVMGGK